MDFNKILVKCPKCEQFTPGPRCIHCGADLHSSANSRANVHQEGSRFKVCSNGHYYSVNLEYCPYCGGQSVTAKPFSQEEHRRFSSEYIIDGEGYYYTLNSDGKTASFICWSKAAWGIYQEYMRFYDWFIECTPDDAEEVKCREEHFAVARIKSNTPILNIPREVVYKGKTYPIVRIRSGAFAFSEILTIIIPNTIVCIEERAFFRCDKLKKLQIPDSVELAERAISQCKDLVTITWRGITYEDDIDEPFLFPDYKDKYTIKENIYDTYDDLCPPPSWLAHEANIPRCPRCGGPIRKRIPDVKWPIIGSVQGGAYDHKVPWNYQWNGVCENCGHDFNIKMAQNLEQEGISRLTTLKVSGKSVPTRFRDAHVGFSGVEIEQNTNDGTTKMFISTNELRFMIHTLKNSPILEQWDWKEDYT